MTKPIPDGYHTVTPYLTVRGATKVIDFLKQAFGAKLTHVVITTPDESSSVQFGSGNGD